jgi:hypothetical protein
MGCECLCVLRLVSRVRVAGTAAQCVGTGFGRCAGSARGLAVSMASARAAILHIATITTSSAIQAMGMMIMIISLWVFECL